MRRLRTQIPEPMSLLGFRASPLTRNVLGVLVREMYVAWRGDGAFAALRDVEVAYRDKSNP